MADSKIRQVSTEENEIKPTGVKKLSKILIVEDEVKISRFLELELTYEGYEVITAADGRVGLTKALSEAVDLIILDLMLPAAMSLLLC